MKGGVSILLLAKKLLIILLISTSGSMSLQSLAQSKVFDVHLHGGKSPDEQLASLIAAGVYKACISTSWELQEKYRSIKDIELAFGLMLPCPNGKVPYSLQNCYEDGRIYPDPSWVEEQIQTGRIDFFGEVLSQYHGISSSDSSLLTYYQLATRYNLPVGIHTGSAGPNHGCPDFSEAMGNPELLRPMLTQFPSIKVWIMHGGAPYVNETISIMKDFPNVYADLSAINFPSILPHNNFEGILKVFIDAGLEDRLMFGSDNNDIATVTLSKAFPSFHHCKRRKYFSAMQKNFSKNECSIRSCGEQRGLVSNL
jgi:hypothetical protein